MGLIDCDRKGCVNIMCDRYTVDGDRICYECFDEFRTKYQGRMFTPEKFAKKLKKFMETEKVHYAPPKENEVSVDTFLDEHVKSRSW